MEITDRILENASLKGLMDPEYIKKVWILLEGMKPGDVIIVKNITKENTRQNFIESVKLYMEETRETYCNGLSFRHGYEELAKYDIVFNKGNKTPSACGISPQGGRKSANAHATM